MGMTVLYIAFGFVALWLLAEVLMQYKARLRWRLLAFAGFVGVVAGVVLPSVLVIAVGAAAFAVGQTLVTLSFRKGFEAGWALRRGKAVAAPDRPTRRRRGGAARTGPALEVTSLEYGSEGAGAAAGSGGADGGAESAEQEPRPRFRAATEEFYSPEPLPDETGTYGIQSFAAGAAEQDAHGYAAYQDAQSQGGGYDYSAGYPDAGGQQVYAAYSDPYIGTGGGVIPQQPYDYTPYAGQAPDPYGGGAQDPYGTDTPPGGVWVPQQRDVAQPYPEDDQAGGPYQQPRQYPYQGTDEYEQYRY
ncbi:hypothetical protein [Streptomyces globosus]|uniref:hypothetical protein n=1 Tax=Streptomyces globosus TaxID=68209 RepID=UPI00381BCE98